MTLTLVKISTGPVKLLFLLSKTQPRLKLAALFFVKVKSKQGSVLPFRTLINIDYERVILP